MVGLHGAGVSVRKRLAVGRCVYVRCGWASLGERRSAGVCVLAQFHESFAKFAGEGVKLRNETLTGIKRNSQKNLIRIVCTDR